MKNNIDKNQFLSIEEYEEAKSYWFDKLSGVSDGIHLHVDSVEVSSQNKSFYIDFNSKLSAELLRISKNQDESLYVLLLSIFKIILYKYTGQKDIVVCSPIYNYREESNNINKVVLLRDFVSNEMTFKEFLTNVMKTVSDGYRYQYYPMDKLFKLLEWNVEKKNILSVALALESIHNKELIKRIVNSKENDFTMLLTRNGDELNGEIIYKADKFSESAIQLFIERFFNIATQVLDNLNINLNNIDLATNTEIKEILNYFNNTQAKYPDKTIHELFEEQVARTPDNIAVIFKNQQLTYGKLNEKANQLARVLRNKGVGPNSIVGIMVERSINMVISILGVLKAGGAYLPLDPEYPENRILKMLNDSNTSILLTHDHLIKNIHYIELLNLDVVNNNITITRPRAQIKNLDSLPYPDRTLVDYDKYKNFIGFAYVKNTMAIQCTRGCPYSCYYCHRIWPRSHIVRSAENIFKEIQQLYNAGVRRFAFVDDVFNLDIENSSKLFKLIIKNNMEVQLYFPPGIRGDILTKEYIDLMVEAGTVQIAMALETASPRLQKLIGKNLNVEKLRENINYLTKKYPHVILDLFFMIGFPTETEEEALMTLNFVKSIKWIHFPVYNVLKIYLTTDMENLALEKGISQEAINRSAERAFHELPDTLPFSKDFVRKLQWDFMNEYFLSKERLSKVLEIQSRIMSEDEIIQGYNNYLPGEINSIADIMKLAGMNSSTFVNFNDKNVGDYEKIKLPTMNTKTDFCRKPSVKILLIDLSQYFSHKTDRIYDVAEPPLGLMYLMTYLKKKMGSNIQGKIIKSRFDFDNFEELKQIIDEFKPDIIGVRTITFYRDLFHKTISLIRQWGIEVPIIVGGPYATSDYKTALQDNNIDVAVLGEGEITFHELVKQIMENGNQLPDIEILNKIEGIAFINKTKNNTLFDNSTRVREVILLDKINETLVKEKVENLERINKPNNLAYVIYTSGSTGKPKGVIIEHRSLTNTIQWRKKEFKFKNEDNVLQLLSYSFDAFIPNFFTPVVSGSKVVILDRNESKDPVAIKNIIIKQNITHLPIPPSLYSLVLQLINPKELKYVKTVILGGERSGSVLIGESKQKNPDLELINEYGPTESTIIATVLRDMSLKSSRSIGKPISNTQIIILGNNNQLQPIGVPGELCISGDGLARGYLNNPDLTAEKFVDNPFISGEKMYRTGDLARWLPDGNIEFLGRVDDQVKIRGYRIELGEIENCLLNVESIKEAVVTAIEDEEENKIICAYFAGEEELTTPQLRKALFKTLPDYMIPSHFIQLEAIPLTSNGKVDIKALPEPGENINIGTEYVAPSNEIEEKLVLQWQDILGIDIIGTNDNFFELGGHSIKATILASRINEKFNVKFPLKEVFKIPTILEMADYIKKCQKSVYTSIQPVKEQE